MTIPLLTTKLYSPPPRPNLISRPRLIEKLNNGLSCKLALISGPAGFGKTTLLSKWIHQQDESGTHKDDHRPLSRQLLPSKVAWLSLDEADNEVTRLLTYIIAALQKVDSHFGQDAMVALQSPGGVNLEVVLTSLINEIAESGEGVVLILDDYHVIESQPVDQAITFLLDHLPSQMHLVIASRIDPSIQLSRLRARGQMIEIRAIDLRFTLDEAALFLNQAMNIGLQDQEVAALEERTEGWIAGLQLAALSMQGLKDSREINDFVNRFTGSDRYIQDYLADEVLRQCPEGTRDFLLHTSILHRMSASLCDAVTGMTDSQSTLENLEAANLFIIPLDNQRCWYRYHHLFADLLNHHLGQTFPGHISELHRRASEWYDQNGLRADAIHHALAAKDFERAAGLVELAWPAMDWSFQSATWLGWVKALPDELVRARPVISAAYAWALLDGEDLDAAEGRLLDAERWLDTTADMGERHQAPSVKMVVVDDEQFLSLPASIASARAYVAQAHGDVHGTVKYAQRALNLLPEGDYNARGRAAVLMGLAYWTSGDLDAAHRSFSDAMTSFQMAGNILFAISFTFILSDIRMTQGRLHEALNTYEKSMRLAMEQDEPMLSGMEDLLRGISELHLEWGDREAASQHLLRSEELSEKSEIYQYRLCVAQARLMEAQGDLDGALDLFQEAERLYYKNPVPDVRPIAALKTRVWIAQGRMAEARDWVREQGLSVDNDLSYLREFEHITFAKVLIARYKRDREEHSIHEAMGLLERLLKAGEEGGRTGSVIEILVLQALALEAQGDIPTALKPLKRALTLAEPEGYFRIFVGEGTPVARLLSEARSRGISPDYTQRLLTAFSVSEPEQYGSTKTDSPQPELIKPLSERELEVLNLVAQGLTNREISERLFIALDTVKGHIRRIYSKLGVKNRTQAINKSISLKIISPQESQ